MLISTITVLFVVTVVIAGVALAALLHSDTQTTALLLALDSNVATVVSPKAETMTLNDVMIRDAYFAMVSPKVAARKSLGNLHAKLVMA